MWSSSLPEGFTKWCVDHFWFKILNFSHQVTFVGGLKFSSLLPFPLCLRLVSQPAALDSEQQSPEYHLPAYGNGELPFLTIAEATGVQARQTGQTKWSLVLPIGSHRKGWSRPQLITEASATLCWCERVYDITCVHM